MIGEGQLDVLAGGAGRGGVRARGWPGTPERVGVDAVAGAGGRGRWSGGTSTRWCGSGSAPVVLAYYLVVRPAARPGVAPRAGGVTFAGIAPNAGGWSTGGGTGGSGSRRPRGPVPLPDVGRVLGEPADYPPLLACLPARGACCRWPALPGRCCCGGPGTAPRRGCSRSPRPRRCWWRGRRRCVAAVPAGRARPPHRRWPPAFLVPATRRVGVWRVLARARLPVAATSVAVVWLLFAGWADGPTRPLARAARVDAEPLLIGLTDEQHALIAVLSEHTTPEARILWDETPTSRPGLELVGAAADAHRPRLTWAGWTPDAGVEHSYCAMCSRQLTGRPLADWSDDELDAFCRWYNVGWVVARSPAAVERWGRFPRRSRWRSLMEGGLPVVCLRAGPPAVVRAGRDGDVGIGRCPPCDSDERGAERRRARCT